MRIHQGATKIQKKKSAGYIIMIVAVFLAVLGLTTMQYFTRSVEHAKLAGTNRDHGQSLLLAESAMEHLRGRFIEDLSTPGNPVVASCTNSLDSCRAAVIEQNTSSPDTHLLPYMFYTQQGSGISSTVPEILRNVANGESTFVTSSASGAGVAAAPLRVKSLFNSATKRPFLYGVVPNNGMIQEINSASWTTVWENPDDTAWDGLVNNQKAAAWIEVIKNPNGIDLFVQAVGQVGNSKSYVQRNVGGYFGATVLGTLPLLAEANPNPAP